MSVISSAVHIPPGKIGPIQIIGDDVYVAEAVAPTGEKMFLAMEPMGDGEKWEIYKNTAGFLTYGGNSCLGTIGSLTELGSRIGDEVELHTFLASRTYPDYWTSDSKTFDWLKAKLKKRKITVESAKAKEISTIVLASYGINVIQQTHMVYAFKTPVSNLVEFSASPDKKGFDDYIDRYGDIIMCVGVKIRDVVENRGIFRNPLSVVEGGYGGISMMLHSFTCLVVQEKAPSVESFQVRPLKRMGEIFLQSLPKEKVTVDGIPGDKYDMGFESEHDVRVPIKVLAELHRIS